jgi:hypothetical protein
MRSFAFATAIVLAAALPMRAFGAEPSAAELVAARGLFTEGLELEKQRDYAGALARFRRVAAIKSTAIVRYHEGWNAERLGRWVEALDAYGRAQVDGQGDPKQQDAVEASRKAAEGLRARVPKIHPKVTGARGDYTIRIDGSPISAALVDTAIPVDPGKHVVELTGAEVVPQSQEVTVAERETKDVVFEATPAPGAQPKVVTTTVAKTEVEEPKPAPKSDDPSRLGLVFGLDLGLIQPGGKIVDPESGNLGYFANPERDETDQSRNVRLGASVEASVGFRFAAPFAVHLFLQHGVLGRGPRAQPFAEFSASTSALGLSLSWLSNPRGPLGAFAELGVSARSLRYEVPSQVRVITSGIDPLRLKIGAAYRVSRDLRLLGYAWGAFGTYSSYEYRSPTEETSLDIDRTAAHWFAGIAVGVAYDLAFKR